MSVIDTLITDRTQADVQSLKTLLSQRASWTADELAEFGLARHKGAYNASDLNRVQEAMEYLAERFRGYGYSVSIDRPEITEVIPGTSRLPEGYTELEYIESSGTQYIDTGFKPNQDTQVVLDFNLHSYSSVGYVFGCRGGSSENYNNRYGLLYNGTFRSDYGTGNGPAYSSALTVGNRYSMDKNKTVCTLGAETVTNTDATFQSLYNLALFCAIESGTASLFTNVRLYSCQIYDNGTLIRDYIPCLSPDNVVGLYDTVNGVFYGNAGTGVFTAGSETGDNIPTQTTIRDYWKIGDEPTPEQRAQYLDNVQKLRDVLAMLDTTPDVPESIDHPTVEGANGIEQILIDIEYILNKLQISPFYCGEVFCGEV